MYMLREVLQAERGKAPEVVAALRALDQWFEQAGYTNRRIYVDYTGPMDTVVYQWEFESLDQYFAMERGTFVDGLPPGTWRLPDSWVKPLIARTLLSTRVVCGPG